MYLTKEINSLADPKAAILASLFIGSVKESKEIY